VAALAGSSGVPVDVYRWRRGGFRESLSRRLWDAVGGSGSTTISRPEETGLDVRSNSLNELYVGVRGTVKIHVSAKHAPES
jgi:hypothetical protein